MGQLEELSTEGPGFSSAGRSGQSNRELPWREAIESDAPIEHGPGREAGAKRPWKGSQAELQRESVGGEPQRRAMKSAISFRSCSGTNLKYANRSSCFGATPIVNRSPAWSIRRL